MIKRGKKVSDINTTIHEHTSPAKAFQRASVYVPVTVKPFATVGTPITKCCGEPYVVIGRNTCEGTKNGECVFTITQEICVEIPVHFGARATNGDIFVNCISASDEDICSDCESCDPQGMDK